MKQLFGIIFTLVFLNACSESFKTVDAKAFNNKIANRTDITTPEELVKLYYADPERSVPAKISIHTSKLKEDSYVITLIDEGLEDDSQSAEKIIMLARQTGETWVVIQIKKNWKYEDGRGHTNWGTKPCN